MRTKVTSGVTEDASEPSKKTWWTRIAEAREEGRFTEEDDHLAGDWPDCACGEQDPRIPRDEHGLPLDPILQSLGYEFSDLVDANDFDGAEEVLRNVQKRAAELLAALPDVGVTKEGSQAEDED